MKKLKAYRVVVQTKGPGKPWEDLYFFRTDSSFFISEFDKDYIEQIKREHAQDLPLYKVRIVNRIVKI